MVEGHINITADKSDTVELIQNKISEAPDKAAEMVQDLLDIYAGFERDEAPVKWGNLQNAVTVELISPLEGITYPDIYYAPFVIEGTAPHEIYAVNKKALYWDGAEHPITHVHHPGTQPNDFVSRAYSNAEGIAMARTQDFLDWFVEV